MSSFHSIHANKITASTTPRYRQHRHDHDSGRPHPRGTTHSATAPCASGGTLGPARRRRRRPAAPGEAASATAAAPLVVMSAAAGAAAGEGGGGASGVKEKGRTQRIMEGMPSSKQAMGAGGSSTYQVWVKRRTACSCSCCAFVHAFNRACVRACVWELFCYFWLVCMRINTTMTLAR